MAKFSVYLSAHTNSRPTTHDPVFGYFFPATSTPIFDFESCAGALMRTDNWPYLRLVPIFGHFVACTLVTSNARHFVEVIKGVPILHCYAQRSCKTAFQTDNRRGTLCRAQGVTSYLLSIYRFFYGCRNFRKPRVLFFFLSAGRVLFYFF